MPSAKDAPPVRAFRLHVASPDAKRLDSLVALKQYAIKVALDVPGEIIQGINTLDYAYERIDAQPTAYITSESKADGKEQPVLAGLNDKHLTQLDQLTLALTRITFPVTVENLPRLDDKEQLPKFVSKIIWTGIAAAVLSGVFMALIRHGALENVSWNVLLADACKGLLALTLGIVGAVVYVILPDGKLNILAGLDEETKAMNGLRIAMGALLGFVLYIIRPQMFEFLADPKTHSPLELLFPLLGGYSINLVVGILAKAVTALELTLNLDEKRTRASLKRKV